MIPPGVEVDVRLPHCHTVVWIFSFAATLREHVAVNSLYDHVTLQVQVYFGSS